MNEQKRQSIDDRKLRKGTPFCFEAGTSVEDRMRILYTLRELRRSVSPDSMKWTPKN
jgi:hypothetical protein